MYFSESGELIEDDEMDFSASSGDVSIHVVVDPLSVAGQRAASVMQIIRDMLRLNQIVIFTPRFELSGIAIDNYPADK